ncbi:hypothetical protein [Streptomyces sp. NPDC059010]|uniref:hypothetical protein n=1 Tax=Streptomyces sp. NPDC059010 TaxID=3346695 RepID=UPI00367F2D35
MAGAVLASSALLTAAPPAAAAGCTSPKLKVWYDSDQFGTYLKVWFESNPGCTARVKFLKGQIWCGDPVKKVYNEYVGPGRAPLETEMHTLPPKNKCKKLVAKGQIDYYVGEDFSDMWTWKWGDYPA